MPTDKALLFGAHVLSRHWATILTCSIFLTTAHFWIAVLIVGKIGLFAKIWISGPGNLKKWNWTLIKRWISVCSWWTQSIDMLLMYVSFGFGWVHLAKWIFTFSFIHSKIAGESHYTYNMLWISSLQVDGWKFFEIRSLFILQWPVSWKNEFVHL